MPHLPLLHHPLCKHFDGQYPLCIELNRTICYLADALLHVTAPLNHWLPFRLSGSRSLTSNYYLSSLQRALKWVLPTDCVLASSGKTKGSTSCYASRQQARNVVFGLLSQCCCPLQHCSLPQHLLQHRVQ